MSEKRMGNNPLDWIGKTQEEPEKPEKKVGRPRTIRRKYTKSSQEGLKENWTRATFIVREDLLKKLKDYAWTKRRTIKSVVNEMMEEYLDGKEILKRSEDDAQ